MAARELMAASAVQLKTVVTDGRKLCLVLPFEPWSNKRS